MSPLGPEAPFFALQVFCLKHTVIVPVIIDALVLQTFFYSTWVQGVAYQKHLLGPKLTGSGLGEHPKNLGPLFISATVEASNSNTT